jgi:signal transduction histidine kinase/uncharacterized membrane protein YczE
MLRFITPNPVAGQTEQARLQEVELIVSRFRWAMAIFGLAFNLFSRGPYPGLRLGATLLFLGSCVVASVALRRPLTLRQVHVLGIFVVTCDAFLLAVTGVTDLGRVELGLWGAGLMVTFEACVRWYVLGGIFAALVMSLTSGLSLWVRSRHLDLPFSPAAFAFRSIVLLAVGIAAGVIVQILEAARSALARRVRESEVVSTFALRAPELDETDSITEVARLLHDELGFERVVVSMFDPEHQRLVPRAFSGFPADLDARAARSASDRGIGNHRSPAVRCYATNQAVIARASDGEESFGQWFPGDTVRVKLAVPMRAGGRILGVLEVAATDEHRDDEEDARLLESMASQLAQVLEHARLNEMRRDTIAELERLAVMKDDFIAIASHELRTPITALRGFARTLGSPHMNPEREQQAAEVINRQVDRLALLVEDLLAVSLIDSGSHVPTMEPVPVADVAREVVAEASAHASGHEVVVDIDPRFPDVLADRQYLRRVLVNLVSNALKYSPDGTRVELSARVSESKALIAVRDEGCGIPLERQSRLFEKFMRVPVTNGPGGTGLGLYIVKGLVDTMAGSVGVDSSPGNGSRFWVSLPFVNGPTASDSPDFPDQAASVTERHGL